MLEKFHLSAGLPRLWRITLANLNLALGRFDLAAGDLQAHHDFGDTTKDFDYRLVRLRLLLGQAHYSLPPAWPKALSLFSRTEAINRRAFW